MLAIGIALGSVTVLACDTATDPIIGRMPARADTTKDSTGTPRIGRGVVHDESQRAMPAKLAAAIRPR